jgi:Family of unknown function (DUF5763)
LNSRCRGIKRNGEPCSLSANGPDGYCWAHSPQHAEQRRRMASRAGKSKPAHEVHLLKDEIKTLIQDVKAGDLDRNDAGVMIQGYRALKDLIALERQVRETDELAKRLEGLEREALETKTGNGGRRWGA